MGFKKGYRVSVFGEVYDDKWLDLPDPIFTDKKKAEKYAKEYSKKYGYKTKVVSIKLYPNPYRDLMKKSIIKI